MTSWTDGDTFAALLGIMCEDELALFNQMRALERDAAERGVGHAPEIERLQRQLSRMRGLSD